MSVVVAVDFGASSIRVCRVDLGDSPPRIDVVHRYQHQPVRDSDGHLRWDWRRLVAETEKGLVAALDKGPVVSIACDAWGVDYGLLDDDGALLAAPYSYRDHRTDSYRSVVDAFGSRRLYELTGVAQHSFNTIFQLAVHRRDELDRASRLLLLPELLVHHLTGAECAEQTSAGSSGLVDLLTGRWATELCDLVGLDHSLLPEIHRPTAAVGDWRGVPVHLVGGHDTASAVVAMGAHPGPSTAFVASGTWLLVGREQPEPDTSTSAQHAGFTNETAVMAGFRFLRNVPGFWLLEGCRQSWGDTSVAELAAAASRIDGPVPTIDSTDPRFLHPDDMLGEVIDSAGLPRDASPALVTRCLIESMAGSVASVLDQLGDINEVALLGGGARLDLFVERLEAVSGRRVVPGPVEATALGNALVQGISVGVYADLADARSHLAAVS